MPLEYGKELADLLATYLTRYTDGDLHAYLAARSRLPGPRANLELAAAFAKAVQDQDREWKALWALCARWTSIPPEEAPTNDAREFPVFCAIRGIGALGAQSSTRAREALAHVRPFARDPRWRVREAVAMAVQDVVEREPGAGLRALEDWIDSEGWLEMRAVAAGLAEPRLLEDAKIARAALDMHQRILRQVRSAEDRGSEEFRTLRQCLADSISVVVAARPDAGFRWMKKLADSKDPDVVWVVKENLKKGRLVSRFPGWVQRLQAMMRRA